MVIKKLIKTFYTESKRKWTCVVDLDIDKILKDHL